MRNSPFDQHSAVLSVTADYALRALLVLAQDATRPARADVVAARIGAPRNYLAKTLNSLAKAGVVVSARGPLGGFSLARPAKDITIADIADVFDTTRANGRCLLRDQVCDPTHPCAAHGRWSDITRAARTAMTTTTVADLLNDSLSPILDPAPSSGQLP